MIVVPPLSKRLFLTSWRTLLLSIICFLALPATANEQTNKKIHTVINNWLAVLNSNETKFDNSLFSDTAQVNLVETNGSDYQENIKQRIKNFDQGKHSLQQIEISQTNNTYTAIVIINWQHNTRKDVARMQETIKLQYSQQAKTFVIDAIEEKFILPDDGIGAKFKC